MADVTVTSADVRALPGVQPFRKVAGAAVNVGYAVYVASDAEVEPADADLSLTSMAVGIIVSAPNGALAAVAGDMVDVAGPGCRVTGFSGLVPGTPMYVSITAGRISDTRPAGASGDFVWIIGIALDATTILVFPFTDIWTAL